MIGITDDAGDRIESKRCTCGHRAVSHLDDPAESLMFSVGQLGRCHATGCLCEDFARRCVGALPGYVAPAVLDRWRALHTS